MITKTALQLKQDIYRFITDNRSGFNYRVERAHPFFTMAWFTVDGRDFWIYVQKKARTPKELDFIKVTDGDLKALKKSQLKSLRQRCLELH